MNSSPVKGVLEKDGLIPVLRNCEGNIILSDTAIWDGYLKYWEGASLNGVVLSETDYLTGKHIALLWPEESRSENYVELYYNERLVKYTMSILGHIAINVNGNIFNFSHLLNECEIMTEGEYFFRPPLGGFGPSPKGYFDLSDPERPYLDKFGRQFMRTIHVLCLNGIDAVKLDLILRAKMKMIHDAKVDPVNPDYWSGFNKFTNNCTTIIRDSLRECGFTDISGIFPRDMYISAVWSLYKKSDEKMISSSVFKRAQLVVHEAPLSRISPLLNPFNYLKKFILRCRGINV